MKCPYCGSEMEQGHILAGVACWIKKGRDVLHFPRKSKGDIRLVGKRSPYSNENSYLCRKCGKVMIDIPAE